MGEAAIRMEVGVQGSSYGGGGKGLNELDEGVLRRRRESPSAIWRCSAKDKGHLRRQPPVGR